MFEFPFFNLYRLNKERGAALHINNVESTRSPLRVPVAIEVPLLEQNHGINLYISVTKPNAANFSFQMKRTEITIFTYDSPLHQGTSVVHLFSLSLHRMRLSLHPLPLLLVYDRSLP